MADEERRQFEDARGDRWEIHPQQPFKWQFVRSEDGERRIVTPPPKADDPHDLSEEQLRKLLDSGIPAAGINEPLEPGAG